MAFDMSALWREGHAFWLKIVVRFAPRTQMNEFVLSPFLRNKLVQVERLDPLSTVLEEARFAAYILR